MNQSSLGPHLPLGEFEPTFAQACADPHCDRVGIVGIALYPKDNCPTATLLSAHHINLVLEPPS